MRPLLRQVAVGDWFGDADADGDGRIQPGEFDAALDEEVVSTFAREE